MVDQDAGRTKLAIATAAGDLDARDTNSLVDVYVKDLVAGAFTLASVTAPAPVPATASRTCPRSRSADGRHRPVRQRGHRPGARRSRHQTDLYVRDLAAGTTSVVTATPAGAAADRLIDVDQRAVSFGPDDTKVVLQSDWGGYGPAQDSNGELDIYLRDLNTGTTALVSVNQAGSDSGRGQSRGSAYGVAPEFSADGNRILFVSYANDLVGNDQTRPQQTGPTRPVDPGIDTDVFVRDLAAGRTILVSTNGAGTRNARYSGHDPRLAPDGRHVVYVSGSDDLGTPARCTWTDRCGRPEGCTNIYVRDIEAGTISLVSVDMPGVRGNIGPAIDPVLSPDGTKVAFRAMTGTLGVTSAQDAVAVNIFVRDLVTGRTMLATANHDGTDGQNRYGAFAYRYGFDRAGTRVVFQTTAFNLMPSGDNNSFDDIYVRNLATNRTSLVSVTDDGSEARGQSERPAFTPDGQRVIFASEEALFMATLLVAGL